MVSFGRTTTTTPRISGHDAEEQDPAPRLSDDPEDVPLLRCDVHSPWSRHGLSRRSSGPGQRARRPPNTLGLASVGQADRGGRSWASPGSAGGAVRPAASAPAPGRSTSSSLTDHNSAAAAWSRAAGDGVRTLHLTKYWPVTSATSGDGRHVHRGPGPLARG